MVLLKYKDPNHHTDGNHHVLIHIQCTSLTLLVRALRSGLTFSSRDDWGSLTETRKLQLCLRREADNREPVIGRSNLSSYIQCLGVNERVITIMLLVRLPGLKSKPLQGGEGSVNSLVSLSWI
ncbi:hypothetical protein GOODEAATRI_014330 [Goodea atripinnis]|uniref:Uncharacterized protein n=1 Tax=Goodea atripinnis TaxID=208336 RepID=A0ABV0N1F0_9TELE